MTPAAARIAVAIMMLAAIAACGSGGGSSALGTAAHGTVYVAPTTRAPTARGTAPSAPRSATALAMALGCTHAVAGPPAIISIGPTYTGEVRCTSRGIAIDVQTYTPADITFFNSKANQALVCSVLGGFGFKGPLYWTIGADFIVFEQHPHPSIIDPNQHANVSAIADELGTKVTTLPCSATK